MTFQFEIDRLAADWIKGSDEQRREVEDAVRRLGYNAREWRDAKLLSGSGCWRQAVRRPTIHLNGTSVTSLREQTVQVLHSLHAARQALENAAPHGRDYYPQGPDAIKEALEEHQSRIDRIASIQAEMEAILHYITDMETP